MCSAISYDFKLHIPNGEWYWQTFHVLISHPTLVHPFRCFASILFKLLVFPVIKCRALSYILNISTLPDIDLVSVFSQPVVYLLFFNDVLRKANVLLVSCMLFMKPLHRPELQRFSPRFSSRTCIVLGFHWNLWPTSS